MIISDTAVRKSTTVVVLAFLIIIIGVYAYLNLPRENEPDVTIPYVFVSTSYRGVSPTDIETSITIEIEKKLKGLDGVKQIHSISSEGLSSINIEFVTGTDIDKALQDVKDKVDEAKGELPSDLEDDPIVFEVNLSEMPIVIFSLSGTCGLPCLKKIADDLEEDIEAVSGVLEVNVTGGLEREIRVEVDPEKLAYYGLSIGDFQEVVYSENQNTSGGTIRLGNGRFQLKVPGEFKNPEEIYTLVVTIHDGAPVYLKDVAQVVDGFKEETSRSRLNGRDAVNISVKKRTGENIIKISEAVDEIIAESQPTWPSGTEIAKVLDKSHDIKNMVADLENNILTGLTLVLIVIFLVMGIRNALLVSLAIPFSMLLSFAVLYAMGITLNLVVLFSLTLALGMLVDNAIVIVENSYRFMEQGIPRQEAAMKATAEVAYPVIGSTLTTLAAFSPMLFWPGIMGEFMSYLPLTLIVTLSSSLFVALIINPAMISIFMRVKEQSTRPHNLSVAEASENINKPVRIRGFILTRYSRILNQALSMPLTIAAIAFCVLIIMFQGWLMVVGLQKPVEFFPDLQPKGIYVNVDVPEGADIDYIDQITSRIEYALSPLETGMDGTPVTVGATPLSALSPRTYELSDGALVESPSDMANIENIYMKATVVSGGSSAFEANTPNHIGVRFRDLQDRYRPSTEDVEEIRRRVHTIPGGIITIEKEQEGPPTGPPINIEISGDNFAVLGEIAKQIRDVLEKIPHVDDIRDDFVEAIPSVQVEVDRQKAALFGLNTTMIGFALKSAYNGLEVSSFREGDEDYDITVQLAESNRKVVDVLNELMLPAPTGETVPLSTVAKVSFAGAIGDINRIDYNRTVTVKANVDETKVPGPVVRAEAEKMLASFTLPPGYKAVFTGENEDQAESQQFLFRAFLVALLLIFLILVSMFNSIGQPFIIMTSVILSLGGAFLGLALFSQPFGIIMTGVGVISLAGVVVNNAIVLIDYTNKLRERGYELRDAIIYAGATRLRPVLLTAVTTILSLIPMVTGVSFDFHTFSISWVSESSQWWRSMAVVVVFGLMVATFLTLVVVPSLYYMLERASVLRRRATQKISEIYWKPYPYLAGVPPIERKKQ
ncbi:MAG TPA: AcrB/AcrD/AcrF family protein [Desulfofustis sp.]|jgi:multidrug efflux pump|nr:efflux RND transporter permease subunit [Desulfofustis sp. PB-SRB1]HBH27286.1 AcrB/AcrD/AcrF family protein [Desulfofustis sp.]